MKTEKGKLLAAAFLLGALLCVGCGSEAQNGRTEEEAAGETVKEPSAEMAGSIELKEDLPDRDIQIPDYLKDSESEEQTEGGEETVLHLSGEEQAEQARRIAEHIEDSISQVLADKDFYPNITDISVNSECTEFNVTFSSREISLYENVLPMSLCIVGDKFQLYQGKAEDELMTVVNYIDENSGEVFGTTNSADIE